MTRGEGEVIALSINIIFRVFAAVKRYGDCAIAVLIPHMRIDAADIFHQVFITIVSSDRREKLILWVIECRGIAGASLHF